MKTETNANGEYAMEFENVELPYQLIGYVYSSAPGYETDFQWMRSGSALLVQDLRLRAIRPIRAGESTSVSVEPDSSLCSDREDLLRPDIRCEVVRVETSQAGITVVDVRAAAGSSVVPLVFWATTDYYAHAPVQLGPSTVSIPVGVATYQIFVGVPDGTATQRFDVVTSLR